MSLQGTACERSAKLEHRTKSRSNSRNGICSMGIFWMWEQVFHLGFSIFNIPHLFVDSAYVLGSPMFAWFFCQNFSHGQFFPSGFEGSETIFSLRFRGRNILEKRFYLFEDGYTDIYIYNAYPWKEFQRYCASYVPVFACSCFWVAGSKRHSGVRWVSANDDGALPCMSFVCRELFPAREHDDGAIWTRLFELWCEDLEQQIIKPGWQKSL